MPRPFALPSRSLLVAGCLLLGVAGPGRAAASTVDSLRQAGLENVTVAPGSAAYENRRFRHAMSAAGAASRALGDSAATLVERHLGLETAALLPGPGGIPDRVRYPFEPGFPAMPGPVAAPTRWRTELLARPILTYALGRVNDPLLVRWEIAAELRTQPWRGARARAGVLIPLLNEFEIDELHPDVEQVRPAPVTLEQYAWLRGVGLVSGSVGIFGANRYGASIGVARPLAGGTVLVDAQADLTGFVAFTDTGSVGSSPERWTAVAAGSWRPRFLDAALHVRGGRFLFGDEGVEVELQRTFRDLEVSFFVQRSEGITARGMRAAFHLPPARRPVTSFRALPADRFQLSYVDEEAPIGDRVPYTASREELLRELHPGSLAARRPWFEAERTGTPVPPPQPRGTGGGVSLVGMTGFVVTPWAGVMADREVELGYNSLSRQAAWDSRGEHRNDVYYAALGFLPRLETGLRWSVIPGKLAFEEEDPESELTDADRMVSARVALFEPTTRRPGLAVGIEDAVGTKRFHSTYVVTGMPFVAGRWRGRGAVGYASTVLEATRHVLDGAFGAVEASAWSPVWTTIEHDGVRWNAAVRLEGPFGLRARAAWLDLQHAAFGIGWFRAL